MAAEINHHPMMFIFRDTISGNGFLAGITLSGRALMMEEDGKWWMYGVRPGALAENGETPQEASLRFRNRYREVLFDIASENATFEAFHSEVERFFSEPDEEEERRWEEAVVAVQSNGIAPPAPFCDLPRAWPKSKPSTIAVERLDGERKKLFLPSDNLADVYMLPAAA